MQTGLGTAGRLGVMFLVALVAAVAWIKPLEAPASETLDAAMKKAFITFATARALNGGISLLQSGQVSVQAVGGVSFNPGEVLDPINDLVEQFSNVMLAATVALGIQKVLLAMGMHGVLPVLVTAVAAGPRRNERSIRCDRAVGSGGRGGAGLLGQAEGRGHRAWRDAGACRAVERSRRATR